MSRLGRVWEYWGWAGFFFREITKENTYRLWSVYLLDMCDFSTADAKCFYFSISPLRVYIYIYVSVTVFFAIYLRVRTSIQLVKQRAHTQNTNYRVWWTTSKREIVSIVWFVHCICVTANSVVYRYSAFPPCSATTVV